MRFLTDRSVPFIVLRVVTGFLLGIALAHVLLPQPKPVEVHKKVFHITCVDSKGNQTYDVTQSDRPASNALQGLGTCSYTWK